MDNDFRSLELGSPFWDFAEEGEAVYRELSWNTLAVQNGRPVGRPADPDQNEIQCGVYVIRHPLKVDGLAVNHPGRLYVRWNSRGCFRGVESSSELSTERLLILVDYADRCMGLHNFDFWKVLEDG